MNGVEALKALAEGKRVKRSHWGFGKYVALDCAGFFIDNCTDDNVKCLQDVSVTSGWEICEDPLSDEDLIAEFQRLASTNRKKATHPRAEAYLHAAQMLRLRKIVK